MNAAHIAVVDDEPEICELLSMRLELQGYRVSVAVSAEEGLALVATSAIDAMILDLKLGRDDGLEVLSVLQKEAPELPVIILTAHGTSQTAVQAAERGAWAFLSKPFCGRALLETIAQALEQSTPRVSRSPYGARRAQR
jgi:two-component system response regulator GlrR